MNSPTNLDTLLKEILITPLVGAMMERGIKPAPVCEECGEPSTHVLDSEDRCLTDRGTEVRNVKVYLCGECYEQFWERAR